MLGDATSVRRVAACRDAGRAAATELEVLARADLIDAGEGRFVHPMVREIVEADLGAERSSLHRRAARLLADDGALDGVVATHLLAAEPERDPWAAGCSPPPAGARWPRARRTWRCAAAPRRTGRPRHPALARPAEFRTGADPLHARRGGRDRNARRSPPRPRAWRPPRSCCAASRGPRPSGCARRWRPPRQSSRASSRSSSSRRSRIATTTPTSTSRGARGDRLSTRPCGRALLGHLAHARALAGAPRDEVIPPARRALADPRVFARIGVERFAALWAIEALLAVEAAPEAGEARAR